MPVRSPVNWSVPAAELYWLLSPTATQNAGRGQLTALNRLARPAGGAGTARAVHCLPFHSEAAARPVPPQVC